MFNFLRQKKLSSKKNNVSDIPSVVPSASITTPASQTLSDQIRASLPDGMVLPQALDKLFIWMHAEGLTWENNGSVGGALVPFGTPNLSSAPNIEFSAEGSENLKYWFGQESDEIKNRLYVFCQTGGEGSMGAFWLDNDGSQKIVHLGSGSGSTMVCVLTDNALDFLRLLAIGYEEICWGGFDEPPTGETPVNIKFREWVETEFSTNIPTRGSEIVKETPEMGDEDKSFDPFLHWTAQVNAH